MNYSQTIILSITEGLTEFLPISSTGHLVLASKLLAIPQTEFVKSFEIIIQLGAILSVVVLYWNKLLNNIRLVSKIIVAFIPTAVLGFIFYGVIKEFLIGNTMITLLALFFGGITLLVFEMWYKEQSDHIDRIEDLSFKNAVVIGFCQSVSMVPGVSRAAATILGGLFVGLKRRVAVEFSFLLAIPTMAAATGLDMLKTDFQFTVYEYGLLVMGFVGAFVTALLAVKFLLSYIQYHTFIFFAVYRIVLAFLFWLLIMW